MTRTILQSNPGAGYFALKAEIDAAVSECLESRWYILGAQVREFEAEFAHWLGAVGSVGVGSGTDALHIALRALEIGPGDCVFVPSHTAVATVTAIDLCGATPHYVDVYPSCLTMDAEDLKNQIELVKRKGKLRPAAVIPVHLYGQSAHIEKIVEIAQQNGLKVLEDCAQSHGATRFGKTTGTWGDVAAFSFYPTKNLGALGDGGGVASNDGAVLEQVRLLREYGWQTRYVSAFRGMNTRLDELQAAILRVKLKHLTQGNERRAEIARIYSENLASSGLILPLVHEGNVHIWHQYVVRVPENFGSRDDLQQFLKTRGVGTIIHYPVPVHQQPAYAPFATRPLPQTEAAAREVLSLPMYPELSDEDALFVAQTVNEWVTTR